MRGGKEVKTTLSIALLKVNAHGKKKDLLLHYNIKVKETAVI